MCGKDKDYISTQHTDRPAATGHERPLLATSTATWCGQTCRGKERTQGSLPWHMGCDAHSTYYTIACPMQGCDAQQQCCLHVTSYAHNHQLTVRCYADE